MLKMLERVRSPERILFKPPTLGSVLYLPGLPGGGNKIYDRSPYGNIGTITGATWERLPTGLWTLLHDGVDDYTDCGNAASLNNLSALTAIVWVNLTTYGEGDVSRFFSKEVGWYFSSNSGGIIDFRVDYATTDFRERVGGGLGLGVWLRVGITWNGIPTTGNAKIYLNGVNQSSSTLADGTGARDNDSASNLLIGSNAATFASLKGRTALPLLYNEVKSASQMLNDFNQTRHLFGVW